LHRTEQIRQVSDLRGQARDKRLGRRRRAQLPGSLLLFDIRRDCVGCAGRPPPIENLARARGGLHHPRADARCAITAWSRNRPSPREAGRRVLRKLLSRKNLASNVDEWRAQ